MKVYISKNNKLKIASSKGIKEFHPIYIVDENVKDLEKLDGLEDIGTLFDLSQLLAISQEVNNKINTFNNKIDTIKNTEKETKNLLAEAENNLNKLKGSADVLSYTQECIDTTVDRLIDLTETIEKINFDGEQEAEKFKQSVKSETDRILNNMNTISKSFGEEVSYKLKEMQTISNTINATLDKKIKDFEDKIEYYNKEMNKMLELSKKWANNPVNMPVEDGLYSAKHYSQISKTTTIIQSNGLNFMKKGV